MAEKRKHKRVPLHFYLQVSEKGSSKQLGYMIEVSKEGLKLLSEEPIKVGNELLCVLHLPEEFNDRRTMSFIAKARWCHQDDNSDNYVSGYHIDEMEPNGSDIISVIMHYYGQKEEL